MKENSEIEKCTGSEYVIVTREQIEPKFTVCDMCGHKNPDEKELCEKCSNYLKG